MLLKRIGLRIAFGDSRLATMEKGNRPIDRMPPDVRAFFDATTERRGYCRILLDGMDIGIDVFPFRKGAAPLAIKATAAAVVGVLNAADYWRSGRDDGSGPERLEDAIDALDELRADGVSANPKGGMNAKGTWVGYCR